MNFTILADEVEQVVEEASKSGMASLFDNFIDKLIPDLWSFLVELLALIVLIVVFLIFGYKPIKKMLNKRQDHIEENINAAEENNRISEINKTESEKLILDSKKEANQIIEEAKQKAVMESEAILAETNDEIKLLKKQADEEIKQKEADSKEEIRKEMVDVALTASSELLGRSLTDQDSAKLVNDFIDDMEKDNKDE
ncbi:MAG: F0F1 ATP synthase subunit B [Coprobacillus sp.]|nr:F0F1 ATP synthase subunit B [Coprobacillus sp.]